MYSHHLAISCNCCDDPISTWCSEYLLFRWRKEPKFYRIITLATNGFELQLMCFFLFFRVARQKSIRSKISWWIPFHFVLFNLSFFFGPFFSLPFISSHYLYGRCIWQSACIFFHPGEKIKASIKTTTAEEMFSSFWGKLSTMYIWRSIAHRLNQ